MALALMFHSPAAANPQGNTTPYKIKLLRLVDESSGAAATINMDGKVWISTLVGEPVIACNAAWAFWKGIGGEPVISIGGVQVSGVPGEVLDRVSLNGVKLGFETRPLSGRLFSHNTPYEVSCDPGAMEKAGGKPSFTVPASYAWNELFYARGSYDGADKSAARYAEAATAKKIVAGLMEGGFATGPDSARVLTARINLRAVVDWVEEQKERATGKQTDGQKADTFWAGGAGADEVAETADKRTDDGFWAGDTAAEREKHEAEARRLAEAKKKKRRKYKTGPCVPFCLQAR